MNLERRISDALHMTDDYQPSVDLFSRVHRSIEEDRIHRRRVRTAAVAALAGVVTLGGFFVPIMKRSSGDELTIPKWSLQVVGAAVLIAVLVTLGPALRRLGGPLIGEVFHLSPATGTRFSRLLDIAYYLFFGGVILLSLDLRGLDGAVPIPGDDLMGALFQVARFLLLLGVAHVANLALLPAIGLMFTSLTRRAARREAGPEAEPESALAKTADRVVSGIVTAVTIAVIAAVLALVAVIMIGLGL